MNKVTSLNNVQFQVNTLNSNYFQAFILKSTINEPAHILKEKVQMNNCSELRGKETWRNLL